MKSVKDIRDEIEILNGSVLETVSSCLRGFMVPKQGHKFLCADFASIEARALAWLVGDEDKLSLFRDEKDLYIVAASLIYGKKEKDVTKNERQVGKVAELALGYQGGKGAFSKMAKNYGLTVTDNFAEDIKVKWRQANPKIVKYWYDVENAAKRAVYSKKETKAGAEGREVKFKVNGSFLFCKLPSGRLLSYPYPKIENKETKIGPKDVLTIMAVDSFTRKWGREDTYGGKLVENITQAVCRDLLVDGIFRLEEKNYKVVFHIHDEIVCEVENSSRFNLKTVEELLSHNENWSKGLPVKAEGWEGFRYKK